MSKLQERLKALQIEGYDPKTETWSPPSEQSTFTPNNSAGISDAQFNQLIGEIDVKRGELNNLKQDVIQTENTIKDKLNNQWWPFGGDGKGGKYDIDKKSEKELNVEALYDMHRKRDEFRDPEGNPQSLAEIIAQQEKAKGGFNTDQNLRIMGGSSYDMQDNILNKINQGVKQIRTSSIYLKMD
jgi:hypothetical protein